MASWLSATVLLLTTVLFTPVENADVAYNLRVGAVDASSVCKTGELCFSDDDCQDCSVADFSPQAAFDGDPSTRWSSILAPSDSVDFNVTFARPQAVSSMQVLFGYSNPPHRWNVHYMPAGRSEFISWFAVVDSGGPCPCSPPLCLDTEQDPSLTLCVDMPDADESVNIQIDEFVNLTTASKVSAVMLEFVELGSSMDARQMFYSMAEISFTVLCLESPSFFSATNYAECPAPTGLYQATVDLPSSTGQSPPQLLWLQKEARPESVAMWYLNSVEFSSSSPASLVSISGGSEVMENVCDPLGNEYGWLFNLSGPRNAATTFSSDASTVSFKLGVPSSCADGLEQARVELHWQQDDSRKILSVYDLRGCGSCTNGLILKLLQISDEMRHAITQVPPFSVLVVINRTELDTIKALLQAYQNETDEWTLHLILSERIYGLSVKYPMDLLPLPASIQQIEDSVNGSIQLKFSMLVRLVDNISKFDLQDDVDDVTQKVQEVKQALEKIEGEYMLEEFYLKTDDLLVNLTKLVAELNRNLQELTTAVARGNVSLALVRSRVDNIDQAVLLLDDVTSLLNEVQLKLVDHIAQSEEHRNELETIESEFRTRKTLLERAANISRTVSVTATAVNAINDEIAALVNQFKMLLAEAKESNATATLNNIEASGHVKSSQSLVSSAGVTAKNISNSIDMLQFHINTEMKQIVDEYSSELDQFRPTGYPGVCSSTSGPSSCMAGELQAQHLAQNSTKIVSTSYTTIVVAEEFLSHLPDFDFDEVRSIASEAINISNAVLEITASSDVMEVYSEANISRQRANEIEQNANTQLGISADALAEAMHEQERSVTLLGKTSQVSNTLTEVVGNITLLQNQPNYTSEAITLSERASAVISDLQNIEGRLFGVETGASEVSDKLSNISGVLDETSVVLDDTDALINEAHALAATASATAEKTANGIQGLMDKNSDLIMNIDALIARASRTHDLVKKINSPVAFQYQPEAFLILQPPPGQQVQSSNGTIQIDTLNINIWRDNFSAPLPALVFYAGPVSDNSEDDLSTGDYIAVTMETYDNFDDTVNLMWRLGQSEGHLSTQQPINFLNQFYITRVGSQFELLTGTSQETLGRTEENRRLDSRVNDGSLLFHVTPKTEYMVGGIPPNAYLALPDAGKYASYQVDYNLLLVNGELWSLWDYSQHSPVNFSAELNHHDNAFQNVWLTDTVHKGDEYYSLSFDGSSYLKPARFVSRTVSTDNGVNTLVLNIRLVSVNGLILFLYDESASSSIEVAMVDGDLTLVYNGNVDQKASRKVESSYYDEHLSVDIVWSTDVTTQLVQDTFTKDIKSEALFLGGFSPLTTRAWMGGVKESELKFPFVPRLTNESFQGCLNMELLPSNADLFGQSFVRDNFFSPDSIMRGVSGTCLRTEAVLEVGFGESASPLSYLFVERLEKPNEHRNSEVITKINGQFTIALSFIAQSPRGVLLGTSRPETDTVIALNNSHLIVLFINDGGQVFRLEGPRVELGKWHDLLLEMSESENDESSKQQRLFVDNHLASTTNHNLGLPDPRQVYEKDARSTEEVLAIGGPRVGSVEEEKALGGFTGCIRNLAFDMDLVRILSSGLTSVETEGIFYDLCPAEVAESSTAVLSVFSSPPKENDCFQPPPAKLQDMLGGFHSSTQLNTSNLLGLFSDKWRMSLDIRLVGSGGRVLTISSETGVIVTLDVVAGVTLDLEWKLSTLSSLETESVVLADYLTNTWIPTEISCVVTAGMLNCDVSAGDNVGTLSVPHPDETFAPILPMSFGLYNDISSFAGCIGNVSINGNQTGFDEISTCTTCYEKMETGLGFTGTSYISKSLTGDSEPTYTISFSFRSERKQGLLLLLTAAADEQGKHGLLLGIGLVEGQARVTNFSTTGESTNYEKLSKESLCNSTNTGFTALSVTVTGQGFSVSLQYENEPQTSLEVNPGSGEPLGDLVVYFGGVPDTFQALESTGPFSFLSRVGATGDGLPHGMIGCMKSLTAHSGQGDTGELDLASADEVVDVLEGVCATP